MLTFIMKKIFKPKQEKVLSELDPEKLLLQYSFKLLARRRLTESEVRKKLLSKNIGSEIELNKVIGRLKDLQYIDDFTFAVLYLEDAMRRKPQGVKLLRNSLMKKGISTHTIARAFHEKKVNEIKMAEVALQKKLKILSARVGQEKIVNPDIMQKQKIYRFLMSRGFSRMTIAQVLPLNDW